MTTTLAAYAHFTPQQLHGLTRAYETRANLSVRSTAGSGKSMLIRAVATVLPRGEKPIVALAYNTSIEKELRAKLPRDVMTRTSHAFGGDLLRKAKGGKLPPTESFKRRNLVAARLREMERSATDAEVSDLARLCDQALLNLCPADEGALGLLAARFSLTVPDDLNLVEFVGTITERGVQAFLERGSHDFTDMLYLPVKLGLGRGSVDTLLVDEAQDFNALQRRLCAHLLGRGGRIILVGDPEQAIYTFTGADADGMERAEAMFGCEVVELTVTFRCPRRHVALARQFSGCIEAHAAAEEGEVLTIPEAELPAHLGGGELVMSRTNAPLVSFALRLAQQGVGAHLLGRDLTRELARPLEAAFKHPFTPTEVGPRLQAHARELLADYRRRRLEGKALHKTAAGDADLLACCSALATRAALNAPEGVASLDDVKALVTALTTPVRGGNPVRLSTIHKAKGLEADRVVILRPEDLKTEGEEGQAERTVNFVAYTRAKKVLILAPGPGAQSV